MDAVINGRFLNQTQTGVQRFAHGILAHMPTTEVLNPKITSKLGSHKWEQFTLPDILRKRKSPLLLNFCNTAPISYSNQIVTIHDAAVFENPSWFYKSFASYYRFLLPRIARSARHVVTVSEFSKSELQRHLHIPASKISVIHPAVSESFKAVDAQKPTGEFEKKFILMVGGHDPRKNLQWAVNSIAKTIENSNFEVIVVGRPSTVFAASTQRNKTRYIENASDSELKWLYQNAGLVIQPSLYEGFGLVPLEALHCGAKVLVSNIPAHREVLGKHVDYFTLNVEKDLREKVSESLKKQVSNQSSIDLDYSYERSASKWNELMANFL